MTSVQIYTSTCCKESLQNGKVLILGTNGSPQTCGTIPASISSSSWITVKCGSANGIEGTQIKIESTTSGFLQMCGVKVYGTTALTSKTG